MSDKEKILFYTWIGNQIVKYRSIKGITQANLAKSANISRPSIINIEKGKQQIPLHTLWMIAQELGIPIDKLLPLNQEHNPDISKDILIQQIDLTNNIKPEEKSFFEEFFKNL